MRTFYFVLSVVAHITMFFSIIGLAVQALFRIESWAPLVGLFCGVVLFCFSKIGNHCLDIQDRLTEINSIRRTPREP